MTRYATHATMRAQNSKEYPDLDTFIAAHPRKKYAYKIAFNKYRGMWFVRKVLVQDELDSHDNVNRLFRCNEDGQRPLRVSYLDGQTYQIQLSEPPEYRKDCVTVRVIDRQGKEQGLTIANGIGVLRVLEWA